MAGWRKNRVILPRPTLCPPGASYFVLIKPERVVKRISTTLSAHSGVYAMMNIMRHGQSVRGKAPFPRSGPAIRLGLAPLSAAIVRRPGSCTLSVKSMGSKRAAPLETTALNFRLVASPAFKPPYLIVVASLIDLTHSTRLGSLVRTSALQATPLRSSP
ncbi:hypothetical protein OH76DRAFT_287606 [Lentinus brumalis]|uniref:Uncharacterized protein n=1 Tax=Lentinus brumalis TaxID=2498619 RepID=A0A371CKJ9_9APHY|nr:hypothetical protein OH76DRAFT_287606 [Polyporus brumalis]